MKHLVAVYGTLKENEGNFTLMIESGAKHVLTTVTMNKYRMYDGGFPMVTKDAEDTPITVEVYEVQTLQMLDWLEGHPDHFRREPVPVEGLQDMPWMYFGPEDAGEWRKELVADGNWSDDYEKYC